MKRYLYILFVCCFQTLPAQRSSIVDTLDYNSLFQRIEDSEEGSLEQRSHLRAFLDLAEREGNWEERMNGYKNYLHHSPQHIRQLYADSMVYVALRSRDTVLMGSAYLTKGIVFYSDKKYKEALDHYLVAHRYISRTDNTYLRYKLLYNMAHLKYYLGYYQEAITLFGDCVAYFKDGSTRPYLNSLHSLGLCYNRMGDYGRCSETNQLGLAEGKRLNDHSMNPYFWHSEGINEYGKQNYGSALQLLGKAMETLKRNADFANVAVGHFYIGKSLWALKKRDRAIPHLLAVHQSFLDRGYIRPDLRETYELLMGHYEQMDMPEKRLYFIERLLQVDSVLYSSFRYLSSKIHKEYDTERLLREKRKVQELLLQRQGKDLLLQGALGTVLLFLCFILYRYRTNQKRYRQKFENLMREKSAPKISAKAPSALDVGPDVAEALLKQLNEFEKNKGYLKKDMNLVKLAAAFHSNTKYLSKVIQYHKGQKVTDYLNDLKVNHITELLKKDSRLRKYTNAALAEEAGFSSVERFTKAFYAKNGLPVTHFIALLKKGEHKTIGES
ncbi:MAG: helix-turn-helix domain-containing protein [Sediminicola sp.]